MVEGNIFSSAAGLRIPESSNFDGLFSKGGLFSKDGRIPRRSTQDCSESSTFGRYPGLSKLLDPRPDIPTLSRLNSGGLNPEAVISARGIVFLNSSFSRKT
jgi:hypothetical protein